MSRDSVGGSRPEFFASRTPDLLIPMTAHTLYDLIAFIIVIRDFRKHELEDQRAPDET